MVVVFDVVLMMVMVVHDKVRGDGDDGGDGDGDGGVWCGADDGGALIVQMGGCWQSLPMQCHHNQSFTTIMLIVAM